MRHENHPPCEDIGKTCTFETNSEHIVQVLHRTRLASLKTQFYEKSNGSDLSDTVLLVLLKIQQKLTKLRF